MRIKIIALLSAAALFAGVCASAQYSQDTLPRRLDNAAKWSEEYLDPALNPQFDGSSYQIMAMARMGRDYDYSAYLNNVGAVAADYSEYTPASTYAVTSLAISSAGGDPQNINGRNLLADGIYGRPESSPLMAGTVDDISWSLIALDSRNYVIPEGASVTRNDMVSALLNVQQEDGSFGDAYSTALALSALSGYVGQEVSPDSIDLAVNYLSSVQSADGSFGDLETTAAVLTALDTLGVDSDIDMRFVKNNNNVMDGLLSYGASDGSFYANSDGTGEATGAAACAVTSHIRYLDENSSFFSFNSTDMPQSMDEYNRPESSGNTGNTGNNLPSYNGHVYDPSNNTASGSGSSSGSNNNSSSGSSNNSSSGSSSDNSSSNSSSNNSSNGSSGTTSGSGSSTSDNDRTSGNNTNSNTNGNTGSSATRQPSQTSSPSSSSRTTPRPAAITTPRPTAMPRVTIAPRATVAPRASTMPGTSTMRPIRTPKPTVEPELVGPVRMPGPMPAPTSTPDVDDNDLVGTSENDELAVPIAAGIIGLFALAAVDMVFFTNRKKQNKTGDGKEQAAARDKTVKPLRENVGKNEHNELYHAKIHRRTEIHGAYKTREKYKQRGKYKGSYRK